MKKFNLGIIGFGGRCKGLLENVLLIMDNVNIVAVCDEYSDRTQQAADMVKEKHGNDVYQTADYIDLINNENVDTVLVTSAWENHIPAAIKAMEAGKPVAVEVAGAYSVHQCWQLVDTYERTQTPIMMMENCCYGKREMMIMNMIEQGVFGEIVHCSGGYHHDLRQEVTNGYNNRHYRLRNYLKRNSENYPTHELGPIAQILDINRGNRMVSLVSMASKSAGLEQYIKDKNPDESIKDSRFAQGDIVTTIIKCAGGQTITLVLDTTLPRAYSRGFTTRGTKGMYMEDNDSIFIDAKNDNEFDFKWKEKWGNAEEYEAEYMHPVWKQYIEDGVKGGHDGMDWLVFKDFFDHLTSGEPMPIDVYDMASWMSITALSEASILKGGAPVEIPDFTNGKWIMR